MESNKKLLRFFSALADKTRLRMVLCLRDSPKTVNELHCCIGKDKMGLSAISHQLSYLVNVDVIEFEKRGREKHFRLSDGFCWCILKDAEDHFGGKRKCKSCSRLSKPTKKKCCK